MTICDTLYTIGSVASGDSIQSRESLKSSVPYP